MLQVNVDKILPVTEARDKFNQLVDGVEGTDDLYVLTKNGKPAAVVVGVNHLEKLTGEQNIQSIAAGATVSQFSDDSDQNDDSPAQPDDSQTETVFASADDALMTENNSLATQDNTSLDLSSSTPAPSTQMQGTVGEVTPPPVTTEDDAIKPVPNNFSSSIPASPTPQGATEAVLSNDSFLGVQDPVDNLNPQPNAQTEPEIDPFAVNNTPSPNAGFTTEEDEEIENESEDSNTISGQ